MYDRIADLRRLLWYAAVTGTLLAIVGPAVSIAHAAPTPDRDSRPEAVTCGSLLLRGDDNKEVNPAPMLHTEVSIQVTGMLARATVTQRFRNPSDTWAEGIYVFPLPEGAAVDHMRMRVGALVIEGQIQERAEAKRTYDRAKRQGKRASLVEQERPNIFTTSVANIAPHAEIVVEIEYQETLRYDQGQYRLRFPMVVGPRYIPGSAAAAPTPSPATTGLGWAPNTDQVPDASRITPPVRHPDLGHINPVTLRVDLEAGLALTRLESAYHQVVVKDLGGERYDIRLAGPVPADRDFELMWEPVREAAPTAAVFTERGDDATYALVMVMPPQPSATAASRQPREMIMVLDTSGSMHGRSIAQAKLAMTLAMQTLTPEDYFNVVPFNSRTESMFPTSVPATAANLRNAATYVKRLQAGGGTEMLGALEEALNVRDDSGRLRQVLFITDGGVGNELELFRIIKQRLGNSRLFTVGAGSAPNSHFMTKAAQFGRGTFTYIGSIQEVREKMAALFRKMEHPALSDISIDAVGASAAVLYPEFIPDLYLGEPVVVAARFPRRPRSLRIRGRTGDAAWSKDVSLTDEVDRPGVSVLWARRKIAALMDQRVTRSTKQAEVREAVIQVALDHHLVSKYTSLVAVDVTPVRPDADALRTRAMKTNLPAGWSYEHVFGMPRTATWAPAHLLLGTLALLLAVCLWRPWTRYA